MGVSHYPQKSREVTWAWEGPSITPPSQGRKVATLGVMWGWVPHLRAYRFPLAAEVSPETSRGLSEWP